MNVLYLHGLESKPTGPKLKYLKDRFDNYYAPEIDYENPDAFEEIVDLCIAEEFDMIIGSSMGGYFACALGTGLNVPVILFNPAIHSRSFEPYGVTFGEYDLDGVCVLGMDDDLQYSQLTIAQGSGSNSNDTIIKYGSEYLAILKNIDVYLLSEDDFTPAGIALDIA